MKNDNYKTPPYTEAQMKMGENLLKQIDYSIEKEMELGKTKEQAQEIIKNRLLSIQGRKGKKSPTETR